jgi:CheY-like chemotaxis protein
VSAAPRILVVDDDRDVRETVGEFLRSEGFDVVEAANGLEALLQVKRARPAGVVLDLMMPRLGGLDAIKRIRAFDRAIRVVVITGLPDQELHRQARASGAVAVLTKPISPADLVAALRAETAPPAPVQSPAPEPPPAARRAAAGLSAPAEILVVTGEPELRVRLEGLLTARGYTVRLVSDAASGVRAVVEKAPTIVLLDIEMAGLSGVGVLPTIVALAPDTKVIMLSERASDELARRSLAFGAFDCATKPIDPQYLLQSVEAALASRRVDLSA